MLSFSAIIFHSPLSFALILCFYLSLPQPFALILGFYLSLSFTLLYLLLLFSAPIFHSLNLLLSFSASIFHSPLPFALILCFYLSLSSTFCSHSLLLSFTPSTFCSHSLLLSFTLLYLLLSFSASIFHSPLPFALILCFYLSLPQPFALILCFYLSLSSTFCSHSLLLSFTLLYLLLSFSASIFHSLNLLLSFSASIFHSPQPFALILCFYLSLSSTFCSHSLPLSNNKSSQTSVNSPLTQCYRDYPSISTRLSQGGECLVQPLTKTIQVKKTLLRMRLPFSMGMQHVSYYQVFVLDFQVNRTICQ